MFKTFQENILYSKNRNKLFVFICILFFATLTRFAALDLKPFHHDESLHGFYSHNVSLGKVHEYTALLHGPVLYYLNGAWMAIFGNSNVAARSLPALLGVLLVLSPFVAISRFGFKFCTILSILLLASPSITYFSRFLREDAFMMFWIFGGLFSLLDYWKSKRETSAYLFSIFLALQFCNKENTYLHVAIWMLAIIAITVSFKLKKESINFPRISYLILANCILIFTFLYVLFYSSFLQHSKGVWHGVTDGLYRESLLYWWEQNKQRRIDGPFDYHLPIIANYEFLVLPFFIFGVFETLQGKYKKAVAALVLISLLLPRVNLLPEFCEQVDLCVSQPPRIIQTVSKLLHISFSTHLFQIFTYISIGGLCFFESLKSGFKLKAFIWFWLTGMLGIYSHVGEKVPWLVVYILLPLFILSAFSISNLLSQPRNRLRFKLTCVCIFLLGSFTVYKNVQLNFQKPGEASERLVFTQTTPILHSLVPFWKNQWQELENKREFQNLRISLSGDSTWPLSWYMLQSNKTDFSEPTKNNLSNYWLIFMDTSKLPNLDSSYSDFNVYEVQMRHWWIPWPNPNFNQLISYFFTHIPYSKPSQSNGSTWGQGSSQILFLERQFLNNEKILSTTSVEKLRLMNKESDKHLSNDTSLVKLLKKATLDPVKM